MEDERPEALEHDSIELLWTLRLEESDETDAVNVLLHLHFVHRYIALDLIQDLTFEIGIRVNTDLDQCYELVFADNVIEINFFAVFQALDEFSVLEHGLPDCVLILFAHR